MTATLNVTHNGLSHDIESPIPSDLSDQDVIRVAEESLALEPGTLRFFVVDRFDTPQGGKRVYVRPKVPFGAEELEAEARKELEAERDKLVEMLDRMGGRSIELAEEIDELNRQLGEEL